MAGHLKGGAVAFLRPVHPHPPQYAFNSSSTKSPWSGGTDISLFKKNTDSGNMRNKVVGLVCKGPMRCLDQGTIPLPSGLVKSRHVPKNPLFVYFYFILIYKTLFFVLDIGLLVLLILELEVVYACMASVNYISPTPSPAIQCRTALTWNRAKNCSEMCLKSESGYGVLVANEGRGHLQAPMPGR